MLYYATSLLITTFTQADIDLYVSTQGSDDGNGTEALPYQTIAAAQAHVRSLIPTTSEPINVWLQEGTYYVSETLEFTAEDSGTEDQTITYAAVADAVVTLSGGQEITPTWSDYTYLIKVANIGTGYDFDMLYVNSEVQDLARYPNRVDEELPFDGVASADDIQARIPLWEDPSTGFIRGLHWGLWGGNSFKIDGVSAEGELLTTWVGDNNRGSEMHTEYQMVENIFEELDAPGEWFYNSSTGLLYYYPEEGTDLDTSTIEISRLEQIINISGGESIVSHLTFQGLRFEHTNRTLFTGDYELLNRSDWAVVRTGAIYIENAESITIQDSTFEDLGGNAIFLSAFNQNHVIEGNQFLSVGATCINVAGSKNSLWAPNQWDDAVTEASEIDLAQVGPKTDEYPKGITIENNYMYNMGRYEKQTAGVNLFICEEITIKNNTIHRCPRAGINICDGSWGGHIIEYNDLFDCVRETHDHGPINAWGRDRFWTVDGPGNTGENGSAKRPYALLDAYKTTHIRNNRVHYDEPHSFGIDLDDGCSNYWVYNNLCLNTDIKLREGYDRKCFNNILINMGIAMHVWFDECNDEIYNNIILASTPYGPYETGVSTENGSTNRNLFYNNGDPVNITTFDWEESDQDSVTADPLFINPLLLNYNVSDDSPALALGFTNFSMDAYGSEGAPTPLPVDFSTGTTSNNYNEPLMGAEISIVTDTAIQSVLGSPDQDGIYFQEMDAHSYAASVGLKPLDCIRSLNGVTITDANSFWTPYLQVPAGGPLSLTLLRNQVEQTLDISRARHTELLNDTSGVRYYGTWQTQENSSCYYGDITYTNIVDDYCEITFHGTGFSFLSQKNHDMGLVDIFIDDVLQETISLYEASRSYQQLAYEIKDLEQGLHTIKIVNKEAKYLIIDAFSITPLRDIDDVVSYTSIYSNSVIEVDTDDLGQSAYLSTSGSGYDVSVNHQKLITGSTGNTDGAINGDSEVTLSPGDTFQLQFDTNENIAGYDIDSIHSVFGWDSGAGGRSNQGYSVTFEYVDGSLEIISPTHWAPNESSWYWTSVSLSHASGIPLATNVKGITIQMANEANASGFVVAREFDFIGAPSSFDYDYWVSKKGDSTLEDPDADTDNDGISNYFEFYFGTDPHLPNHSPMGVLRENDQTYLQLDTAFITTDQLLYVDHSQDLETWTTYDAIENLEEFTMTPLSNSKQRVRARLPNDSNSDKSFWRLKPSAD